MSSQGSFQSTPADSPHLSATSLSTSQEVPNNPLAAGTLAADQVPKVNSPSPPISMTPPPSSQAHSIPRRLAAPNAHPETTPTPARLSSPPVSASALNGSKKASQFARATKDELQELLEAALVENKKLEAKAAEARMDAVHYTLQYNLLTMETEDAAKRMEAEHEMTRREVAVLHNACQGRDNPAKEYIAKLKVYCQGVEEENAALLKRLEKAKKIIHMKDDELAAAKEREELLITRIRENREHLNHFRSPGGIFYVASPKPSPSYPATPQPHYRSTPKHTPMTGPPREMRHGEDHLGRTPPDHFAALLMADRVLSQENHNNNSAPSTPMITNNRGPRTPMRHHRGVQSLSSLPTTPRSARPTTSNSTLLPSVQFTPREVPRSKERRRKSRDSTISASDAEEVAEEIARAALSSFRGESEEVHESQASQTASEMLRTDPRESFEVAASRSNTPGLAEKSHLLQAKIFGPITKTVIDKRKRGDDESAVEYSAKKLRGGYEGIGLGIGFESRA